MELPGTSYLYTIATLSITYGGFAALIVIFREVIGGKISSYDVFIIRSVLLRSFIVACSALLPPALVLFDLSQSLIWRASSIIAALLQALFVLSYRRRRRTLKEAPPTWALVIHALEVLTAIGLLMNALGVFGVPAGGPFVIGITAFLFFSFYAYLAQLRTVFRGRVK